MNKYVNIEECQTKIEAIDKTLRTLVNHWNLNMDNLMHLANTTMYNAIVEQVDSAESINIGINWLNQASRVYGATTGLNTYISESSIIYTKALTSEITDLLGGLLMQRTAQQFLIDHVSTFSDWKIESSDAANLANRHFRNRIETGTGYRQKIEIIEGKPGNIAWFAPPDGYSSKTCSVCVDATWLAVKEAGLTTVDLAGKPAMPLWLDEIPEEDNPLSDDGVKLYNTEVLYTKVPQSMSAWSMSMQDFQSIVHKESRVIAVQDVNEGQPIVATGKDASWAIRTMRGRMKKRMFEIMDI